MRMKAILLLAIFLGSFSVFAEEKECKCEVNVDDAGIIDWALAEKRSKMLAKTGYHPFLMPLIMENRDFIELSNDQVKTFLEWRSKNRVHILHLMNKIIYERNLFHKLALNPDTSDEVLMTKQQNIFRMQEKVLELQLSCRRNILDTFDEQQWDNFNFVLTEKGYEVE